MDKREEMRKTETTKIMQSIKNSYVQLGRQAVGQIDGWSDDRSVSRLLGPQDRK